MPAVIRASTPPLYAVVLHASLSEKRQGGRKNIRKSTACVEIRRATSSVTVLFDGIAIW